MSNNIISRNKFEINHEKYELNEMETRNKHASPGLVLGDNNDD